MKYYKMTTEKKKYEEFVLHRIEAILDMPWHGVKKGDKGGWVNKAHNLTEEA